MAYDDRWPRILPNWLGIFILFSFIGGGAYGIGIAVTNHVWTEARSLAATYNPSITAKNQMYREIAGIIPLRKTEEGAFAKALLKYRSEVKVNATSVALPADLVNAYFAEGKYPDVPTDTNTNVFGVDPAGYFYQSGNLSQNFMNDLRGLWSNDPGIVHRLTSTPLEPGPLHPRFILLQWWEYLGLLLLVGQVSFFMVYFYNKNNYRWEPHWTELKGEDFPYKLIVLILNPLMGIGYLTFKAAHSKYLAGNKTDG